MNTPSSSTSGRFIAFLLERLGQNPKRRDSGLVARMKRADNPDMTYQAWDTLLAFNIDLERESQRLPYCLIGAALCRHDSAEEGSAGLGEALRSCYEDTLDPGVLRLRRLLSCSTTAEVCQVLRSVLSLIESRARIPLNHQRLLEELLSFETSKQERIKIGWTRQFWPNSLEKQEKDNA